MRKDMYELTVPCIAPCELIFRRLKTFREKAGFRREEWEGSAGRALWCGGVGTNTPANIAVYDRENASWV